MFCQIGMDEYYCTADIQAKSDASMGGRAAELMGHRPRPVGKSKK